MNKMNKYHSSGRKYTPQELSERLGAFSPRYLVEGYPFSPTKVVLLASGYAKLKPFRNPIKRAARKGASK